MLDMKEPSHKRPTQLGNGKTRTTKGRFGTDLPPGLRDAINRTTQEYTGRIPMRGQKGRSK